jgi:hydroxymethylbilane synthase
MLEGRYDAILLAAAGVRRLGLTEHVREHLELARFLPAVAQGAMAIELRADDVETARWVEPLDHAATRAATLAERALLARLEGGCQIPVGAHGEIAGAELVLRAEVCSLDGRRTVAGEQRGAPPDAAAIGARLADELIEAGAGDLLDEIRTGAGSAR